MPSATGPAAFEPMSTEEYRRHVARQMSEAALQAQVISLARTWGWEYFHAPDNRPGGRTGQPQRGIVSGFPDLVLVHARARRILYRELKTETGRVADAQRNWHEILEAAGADVAVWRPRDLHAGIVERTLANPPPATRHSGLPQPRAAL